MKIKKKKLQSTRSIDSANLKQVKGGSQSIPVFYGSVPSNVFNSPGYMGASYFNNMDPSSPYWQFYNY